MTFPFWRRRRREDDLQKEIETHLEMARRDRVERGEAPDKAQHAVCREFGNLDLVQEAIRNQQGRRWAENLVHDLRHGIRMLRKNPGFTVLAVVTLALGIGANSAIFSVVDAVLLRPLPYREPDRLVTLAESDQVNSWASRNAVAPGNFLDWREQNHVFEQIGAVSLPGYNLTGTDQPERVLGAAISGGMLRMLRLQPRLGREIESADDRPGAPPVVMISHSLWLRRFSGDPKVIGKTICLGTIPHTVIGILPAGMQFPREEVDLWVPLEQTVMPKDMHWRDSHYLAVYARLKRGVTLAQARSEMNRVANSLKRSNPNSNSGAGAIVVPLQEELTGDIRPALLTLLVAVGFVLLIACANVASLLLARALGREKEMSIRLALGAGAGRLVCQVLTESVVLSLAGGAGGILVAEWARQALLTLRPASLPRYNTIGTDGRVLIFTLLLAVVTGILFGMVPAFRAARSDLKISLHGISRTATAAAGARRLRNVFVAGQIAVSLVLLVGAGLLIRSFIRLRGNNLGFHSNHIVTARVSIPQEKYARDDQVAAFCDRMLENVRSLPGVEGAGTVSFLPLTGQNSDNSFDIVGRPPRQPSDQTYALVRFVDSQYFGVMGIPLLSGRGLESRDQAGAPRSILISESMARQCWPGVSPLGQHIKVHMGMDQTPWEVVGVVGDVRSRIASEPGPTMYFPYAQFPYRYMVLTVRTHMDPATMLESIRKAVRKTDPDQPISQVRTLDGLMEQALVPWRFSMTLLGAFAALALLLSASGIYGVISYTVGQRTREIGVRMALGAQPGDVFRLILRQGMGVALAGIGIGLVGSLFLTRFLGSQLYGVRPTDALTFATIPLLMAMVALAASYVPARRATRVDPMVALRYE